MKITAKQAIAIVLLAQSTAFISCIDSEKDVYDSSIKTENPLGDLSAPDGFDFSTTVTSNVTVDVNDEYSGQYYYTVKIFDNNPLATDTIVNTLAVGVAKTGEPYSTEIVVPTTLGYIYVQQTDPRGRSVIKQYPVAETIACNFSTTTTSTKASVATRSVSTRSTVAIPDYTTIPTGATEINSSNSGTVLQANSNYKITGTYNGTFTHWGTFSGIKLYISGTWNVPSNFTVQSGLEVIVMAGGKIETTSTLQFVNTSYLTIMPSGSIDINTLTLSDTGNEFKNWGTANITNTFTASSGALFYTKGTITAKDASFNSTSPIQNEGTITLSGKLSIPSNSTLTNSGEISAADMETNSNAVITNDGEMTFDKITTWNGATVNNNCYIESKTTALISGCIVNLNQGYIKAQDLTITGTTVNFSNGSMIEATNTLSHTTWADTYNGGTTGWSLLKAPTMTGQGFSYNGNLMVEVNNHPAWESWGNYYLNSPAQMAACGTSNIVIEVCTGTVNGGNSGTDPTDPTFPISVEDNTNYTYIFEDQWPLYGDYDMNDLVLKLNKKTLSINSDNTVGEVEFEIELAAAGATKVIAAGLQLDNVSASAITQAVVYNNKPSTLFDFTSMNIEEGQSKAVIPLFADAHKLLGSSTYTFVNTVKGSSNNVSDTPSINVTIKFDSSNALTAADFVNSKLNFFIITDGRSDSRKEIHVAGYKPTDKANTAYFGNNNDASSVSSNKYYISQDNLAWGIIVPKDFKYPVEYAKISEVYSKFSNWLTTGGVEDEDWYDTSDSNKTY
jgi:LruC domain-containing protein